MFYLVPSMKSSRVILTGLSSDTTLPQRINCARHAIDAPIYAILKTTSKLAKDLVFRLWIPGECFVEDSRVRRNQRKFPNLNIVAEGNLSALR
jgi:hypothetical protein